MNARQAFTKLKGHNFMTPNVIEYFDLTNGLFIEVSEGTGFNNDPIFGITVINADGTQNHDKSTMFQSKDDAYGYVGTLESSG